MSPLKRPPKLKIPVVNEKTEIHKYPPQINMRIYRNKYLERFKMMTFRLDWNHIRNYGGISYLYTKDQIMKEQITKNQHI